MAQSSEEILALIGDMSEFTRHLPPVFGVIARLAGFEAMAAIGLKYGGGQVYIPGMITDHSALVSLIGLDAGRALSEHFANGFSLHLPIPNSFRSRELRRWVGLSLLSAGIPARQVGVGLRTVDEWRERYIRQPADITKQEMSRT